MGPTFQSDLEQNEVADQVTNHVFIIRQKPCTFLDTVELVIDANENLLDCICFRKNSVWIKSRVPIFTVLFEK